MFWSSGHHGDPFPRQPRNRSCQAGRAGNRGKQFKAAGVCERRQSQRGRTDKQKEETETNKTRKDQHTFTTLRDNQRKKGIKVEDEKQTQAMEATVDEDDGTFTNISLADDTGNPLLQI